MTSRYVKQKHYAATAQAEYRHGDWNGSVGLRGALFDAPDQVSAERKAHAKYMQEWSEWVREEKAARRFDTPAQRRRKRGPAQDVKLVKIHLSVVEV